MVDAVDTQEKAPKRVGWKEIVGAVAAGAVGYVAGGQIVSPDSVANKFEKELSTANNAAMDAFTAENPIPTLNGGTLEALQQAMTDWRKKSQEAVSKAEQPIWDKMDPFMNPLTRPYALFKEGDAGTKVALLAAIAVPLVAVGYGIHKFRNRHAEKPQPESHAQREQERAAARSAEMGRA